MNKLSATKTEKIFAFAMVCSVWTQIRVAGVIGLSEVLLILLGAFGSFSEGESLPDYHKYQDSYVKVISLVIPFGMLYNFVGKALYAEVFHDLFAFVFVGFMIFFVFNKLKLYENLTSIFFYYLFFELIVNAVYFVLYFSGRGMYMDERFSGFSADPNQLAEALFLTPWFFLYFATKLKSTQIKAKFLYFMIAFLSAASSVVLGILTDSDTFDVSLVIGAAAFLIYEAIKTIFLKKGSIAVFVAEIIAAVIALWKIDFILSYLSHYVNTVATDANQFAVRKRVWLHGFQAFLHSPIVGNGPGAFSGNWAPFGGAESHNTYIYILMDFGLVGFFMLLRILFASFNSIKRAELSSMFAAFGAFLIFNWFHSFHRMPLFWFYIFVFVSVGIAEGKFENVSEEHGFKIKKKPKLSFKN